MSITHIRQPRCYLVYALAPEDVSPRQANATLNAICGDATLPLTLYHDHFIGQAGGIVLFYAEDQAQREALQNRLPDYLDGWQWAIHPLIFSRSPAGFDEQIRYTLAAYRNTDWNQLRQDKRPVYGNPAAEADSAEEVE